MKEQKKKTPLSACHKNMRSMQSSKRIKNMICELESYRWNAVLLDEIWMLAKSKNFGDTSQTHVHGSKKYNNTHGVGMLLNKKWQQIIIDIEYISERAITTTIVVNHQRIKLMSVYFPHSKYADNHVEKCTENLRTTRIPATIVYRLLEEISSLHWGHDAELSVPMLVRTL